MDEYFLREMARVGRDELLEEAARARLAAGRPASRLVDRSFPALAGLPAPEPAGRGRVEGVCCA